MREIQVWRQDDNGHRFLVTVVRWVEEAERLVDSLVASMSRTANTRPL